MRSHRLTLLVCLAAIALAAPVGAQTEDLGRLLELHQKILVLLDEASARDDASLERTARLLYGEKQDLIARVQDLEAVVRFASRPELADGDRLAFVDLLENERGVADGADALRTQLEATERLFGDEIGTRRGPTARPRWRAYIDELRRQHPVEDILREHPHEPPPGERGAYGEHAVFGYGLPNKHIVLTFDDGPHPRYTDKILATLDEHGATAYFFAVGKNLGTLNEAGAASWTKASLRTRLAHEAGHVIANHSYTHRQMTKLSDATRASELNDTNQLVEQLTGTKPDLFRPPYGETSRALTDEYAAMGMTSILWNVDSWDWGDPVPESIAARVVEELDESGRGILLFHDVHKQTVAALPLILDELESRGFEIARLDGSAAAPPTPSTTLDATRANTAADAEPTRGHAYRESWAVVIGINEYRHWPRLSYAVNDADAVASHLIDRLGFRPTNVFTLTNVDATRERIVELLGETLADPNRVGRDDRVFVFFAGHGATRKLPSGKELGYIVPVDAELASYAVRSISMSQLEEFSELIPAKHVYFVMDSCYSGLALTRGGVSDPYLHEITSRTARQILTAGGADESVADGGPGGHSIFTWTLLQGLSGLADLDGNGILTASELGAFTAPIVSQFSSQTPAFGNLAGSAGGEFVFELEPEGLSAVSEQLDTEALAMSAELEALQTELAAKLERNLLLHQQVARLREDSDGEEERLAQANRHHALGLQYFREKRYQRAIDELSRARALNPANATIVNNYGFVLYRMGRHEESIQWFLKTIELDPERAVVYVNLGDALWHLGRHDEAKEYYRRYLELWPGSPRRDEIETLLP